MKFSYKHFIPKSFELQPWRYRLFGMHWAAVFELDEETYYIELDRCVLNPNYTEEIQLLKQKPDCRVVLYRAKTLKAVLEQFSKIIQKKKGSNHDKETDA